MSLTGILSLNFHLTKRGGSIPEHLASPDIILAADCVYFEPAFSLLQETLLKLTNGRNVEVYMAYKKRRKVRSRSFFLLLIIGG